MAQVPFVNSDGKAASLCCDPTLDRTRPRALIVHRVDLWVQKLHLVGLIWQLGDDDVRTRPGALAALCLTGVFLGFNGCLAAHNHRPAAVVVCTAGAGTL